MKTKQDALAISVRRAQILVLLSVLLAFGAATFARWGGRFFVLETRGVIVRGNGSDGEVVLLSPTGQRRASLSVNDATAKLYLQSSGAAKMSLEVEPLSSRLSLSSNDKGLDGTIAAETRDTGGRFTIFGGLGSMTSLVAWPGDLGAELAMFSPMAGDKSDRRFAKLACDSLGPSLSLVDSKADARISMEVSKARPNFRMGSPVAATSIETTKDGAQSLVLNGPGGLVSLLTAPNAQVTVTGPAKMQPYWSSPVQK